MSPAVHRFSSSSIFVLAVAGVTALLAATRWGIGISPDSVSYISTARNLLEGQGLTTFTGHPLAHHPPGLPILLAALGAFGVDPLQGARWLNGLIFGLNVSLVGGLLARCRQQRAEIPVLGALLAMSAHPMLLIHSMAWTEPLFLFSGFLGLALLAGYLEKSKTSLLVAAALLVGFAPILRYAGLALIASGVVGILLLDARPFGKRAAASSVFALAGGAPMTLWSLRNMLVIDAPINRELVFHPPTLAHAESTLATFGAWLLPVGWLVDDTARWAVPAGVVFLLLAVLGTLHWLKRLAPRARPGSPSAPSFRRGLLGLMVLFSFFYFLLLLVSLFFFDAYIPMNHRILSPLYIVVLLVGLSFLDATLSTRRPLAAMTARAILLGIGALQLAGMAHWVAKSRQEGVGGFATRAWYQSELLERIRALPPDVAIFTNGADVVYLFTGRRASSIPQKAHASSSLENESFPEELEELQARLDSGNSLLVYFNRLQWRRYFPKRREMRDALRLEVVTEGPEGGIYRGGLSERDTGR